MLWDESARRGMIGKGLERAREFNWNRTARQIVDCYRELAAGVSEVALESR